MDDILAEIRFFAGNFAPAGWMQCAGQLLPIRNYTALFSLLGTTYGGDGVTNFALPNLQSRVAIGSGQGAGLTNHLLGQQGGSESVTLFANNIPAHTHAITGTVTIPATSQAGNTDTPYNSYPAMLSSATSIYNSTSDGSAPMPAMAYSMTVGNSTGTSSPVSTIQPVLAFTAIISTGGTFPARN
jgi:microcystin-dependent protein